MDLVKCLADGYAAPLQLDLHHRQTVHQNRHIIAVGMRASLLKLLDHLQLVAGLVAFVDQMDVLNPAIVKDKIMDVVILDLAGFVDDAFAGPVQIGLDEARPLDI